MGIIKYKMKDVLKFLNITEGTIRNYEKKGLIHSDRTSNNYRFFSFRDLNRLITIRRLRNLGFSLDTIEEMMFKDNFEDGINRFKERKEADLAESKRLYEEALELEKDIEKINIIHNYLDKQTIIDMPNFKFYQYENINLLKINDKMFDNFATCYRMDQVVGATMPLIGYVKYLDEPSNKKCVYGVVKIDNTNRGTEGIYSTRRPFLDYLTKNNLTLAGNVIAIKLYTLLEDGEQKDYWECYFPIK